MWLEASDRQRTKIHQINNTPAIKEKGTKLGIQLDIYTRSFVLLAFQNKGVKSALLPVYDKGGLYVCV